jgi:ATP-dependent Clp protease adaptor protein ClpS
MDVSTKTKTTLEPAVGEDTSIRLERLYHVIILNDEEHTIEYVVEMLQAVIGLTPSEALACTLEADSTGSSIVCTCPLEEAEAKRDRIHAYGPDWRLSHSRGSVAALVEPAAL